MTKSKSNHLEVLQSFIGKEFTESPSPFMKWLKPKVLEVEEGRVSMEYVVRKEMTNPIGTLHGGVTAAIMDDIIGAAMFSLNEPFFYTTINNAIDYLSAAREDDVLIAETKVIKKGKQFINAECEVWNADRSRLIARGTSNLFKTEIKRK